MVGLNEVTTNQKYNVFPTNPCRRSCKIITTTKQTKNKQKRTKRTKMTGAPLKRDLWKRIHKIEDENFELMCERNNLKKEVDENVSRQDEFIELEKKFNKLEDYYEECMRDEREALEEKHAEVVADLKKENEELKHRTWTDEAHDKEVARQHALTMEDVVEIRNQLREYEESGWTKEEHEEVVADLKKRLLNEYVERDEDGYEHQKDVADLKERLEYVCNMSTLEFEYRKDNSGITDSDRSNPTDYEGHPDAPTDTDESEDEDAEAWIKPYEQTYVSKDHYDLNHLSTYGPIE